METGKQQRSRGKNFDEAEKEVLLDHAIKHKQIIESKLTNSITVQKKGEVWRSATDKINSLGVAPRTVKDVKNKWSNMVQKAKKEKAEAGVYRRKTGGGPPSRALSPITERVVELFGDSPSFNGIVGVETPYIHDDEETVTIVSSSDYSVSPYSSNFIESVVSGQVTPGGDAGCLSLPRTASPEPLSSDVPIEPAAAKQSEIQSTSSSRKIKTVKRRKITPDDVTEAQYEVLQLQKKKIHEQIKYFQLMNRKLEKEFEE